ncbi:caspase-7 [Nelusetta ayraudi]|uniref:caspase-7 n=1 Tax=Nelusetta ayraudi TaxID=303726 RepID=UPI003F72854B
MPQWREQKVQSEACNRAVVVSVAEFDPGVSLGRRPGAKKDAKRIHSTLSKLGFKVEYHMDLSGDEIYELFQKESQRPVGDCFLAVLSSHGEEGCVFGADGKAVLLSRIFAFFDNKHMESKAKLFLIQACRGEALDDGVEVDSAVEPDEEPGILPHLSVPADTAVMYATAPGYGAFSHPLGSVFLQTFCTLLQEEGHRNLELTRLMTRLSHRVAYTFQAKGRVLGGKKVMPCLLTRMTRDVFPFAELGKAGLLATSLVRPDGGRARTRSIS